MKTIILLLLAAPAALAAPLKIYILAGQSNMQGHARIETFDYIGDDPATAPLLREMRGPDGKPRVCDHVWISYLTAGPASEGVVSGKLTAGFGARRDPQVSDHKIGPEFTFGLAMDAAHEEPVLIIKTAWGGKSLYYDFRPPSAGAYPRTEADIRKKRHPEARSGHYYRAMINHVKSTLADIKSVCPAYNEKDGFEIAGFVWFQGFNDMVAREIYPKAEGNRYANYSVLLEKLIHDVRKDLSVPKLPFVIGVMGIDGAQANAEKQEFREAMAAPAALPGFQGNVSTVQTAPFWDSRLGTIQAKRMKINQTARQLKNKQLANKDGSMSAKDQQTYLEKLEAELITPEEAALRKRGLSNGDYHYLGSAKTFALIGKAFAKAMLEMRR